MADPPPSAKPFPRVNGLFKDPPPSAKPFPRVNGLFKQHSWSPEVQRDEAWHRREEIHRERRLLRSKSVTDEDLDEIQGCIDLGLVDADGFAVGEAEAKKLSETFPALDMYYAVKKGLKGFVAASASGGGSSPSGSMASVGSSSSDLSPMGSPVSLFSPGDTLDMKKERLKQWAHVVGWSIRRNSEKKRRGGFA